jgi:hypothetical protein
LHQARAELADPLFKRRHRGGDLLVDERFREAPRFAHQPLEALTNLGRHGVPTAAQATASLRIAIENHRSARRRARFA